MIYLISASIIVTMLLPIILIGRRVAVLLPESTQERIGFFLSPLFGLAILVLLATAYGWFFPFKTIVTLPFLIIVTLIGIWQERDRIDLLKCWSLTCASAFVFSLPILASALLFDGFNPFNDAFTYLVHAQWLQEHPFSEKAISSGFFPALSQVTLYQTRGHRMGASFFFGFVQSAFHLQWSYYAFLGVVGLVFTTGCLAVGAIIRQAVPVTFTVAICLSSLPAITMNGFTFGAQGGFFPQTFGLAFAAGIGCLLPAAVAFIIEAKPSLRDMLGRMMPFTIVCAAFMLTYNDMVVVLGPAIILYILYLTVNYPEARHRLIAGALLVAIATLFLLNIEGVRILRNFIETVLTAGSGVIYFGWPVQWTPMQFVAYAFGLKSLNYFFIFLLSGIVYILVRICREGSSQYTIPFLICINIVFVAAFLKLRYFSSGPGGELGITFLQFKIAKWAAPFDLALLGIAGAWFVTRTSRFAVILHITFAMLFAIGLRNQIIRVAPSITQYFLFETQRSYAPFGLFTDLRDRLTSVPKSEVLCLAIPTDHNKLKQMVAYVLYDRKIAGRYDDGYIEGHIPQNERNMPAADAAWLLEYKPVSADGEDPFRRVGPFYVHSQTFGRFQ